MRYTDGHNFASLHHITTTTKVPTGAPPTTPKIPQALSPNISRLPKIILTNFSQMPRMGGTNTQPATTHPVITPPHQPLFQNPIEKNSDIDFFTDKPNTIFYRRRPTLPTYAATQTTNTELTPSLLSEHTLKNCNDSTKIFNQRTQNRITAEEPDSDRFLMYSQFDDCKPPRIEDRQRHLTILLHLQSLHHPSIVPAYNTTPTNTTIDPTSQEVLTPQAQ